jgi:hypothetical protein
LKILFLFLITFGFNKTFASFQYPDAWWIEVPADQRNGKWEILPQEVNPGEVVLSKRTELGVFSNLALTPFLYDSEFYNSIEGLWQGMKYPDPNDVNDIRNNHVEKYPYTRNEVYLLSGFESKKAGTIANKINKQLGINWISYKKLKFNYKDLKQGSKLHFKIIKQATLEKIIQNEEIKKLLIRTRGLKLMPDHTQSKRSPMSYYYHQIIMKIRKDI